MDRELSPAAIVILVMVVVAAIVGAYFLVAAARSSDAPVSTQPDTHTSIAECSPANTDRPCLLGTNWRFVSGTEALNAA